MFKFLAQMFDQSLDKVLEPIEGKPYGQVMGRIGLISFGSLRFCQMQRHLSTHASKASF